VKQNLGCYADLVAAGMAFIVFVSLFMGALAALTLVMLTVAMALLRRNRTRESGFT
jgi:hypothetical protein